MNKIPKKIYPDNIKEAFVIFNFSSNAELNKIINILEKKLKNNYNILSVTQKVPIPLAQKEVPIKTNILIDYQKKVKLTIISNSITFNIFKEYIGWNEYIKKIRNVINIISKQININAVSIRYISEHKNKDIFNITKVQLKFPNINQNINNNVTTIQKLGRIKDVNYIVAVTNIKEKNKSSALIDITLSKKIKNKKQVFKTLEELHSLEKTIFFSILNKTFLNSLEVKY